MKDGVGKVRSHHFPKCCDLFVIFCCFTVSNESRKKISFLMKL
jgi:hypothetical protein